MKMPVCPNFDEPDDSEQPRGGAKKKSKARRSKHAARGKAEKDKRLARLKKS